MIGVALLALLSGQNHIPPQSDRSYVSGSSTGLGDNRSKPLDSRPADPVSVARLQDFAAVSRAISRERQSLCCEWIATRPSSATDGKSWRLRPRLDARCQASQVCTRDLHQCASRAAIVPHRRSCRCAGLPSRPASSQNAERNRLHRLLHCPNIAQRCGEAVRDTGGECCRGIRVRRPDAGYPAVRDDRAAGPLQSRGAASDSDDCRLQDH